MKSLCGNCSEELDFDWSIIDQSDFMARGPRLRDLLLEKPTVDRFSGNSIFSGQVLTNRIPRSITLDSDSQYRKTCENAVSEKKKPISMFF